VNGDNLKKLVAVNQ